MNLGLCRLLIHLIIKTEDYCFVVVEKERQEQYICRKGSTLDHYREGNDSGNGESTAIIIQGGEMRRMRSKQQSVNSESINER